MAQIKLKLDGYVFAFYDWCPIAPNHISGKEYPWAWARYLVPRYQPGASTIEVPRLQIHRTERHTDNSFYFELNGFDPMLRLQFTKLMLMVYPYPSFYMKETDPDAINKIKDMCDRLCKTVTNLPIFL